MLVSPTQAFWGPLKLVEYLGGDNRGILTFPLRKAFLYCKPKYEKNQMTTHMFHKKNAY